MKKLIHTLLLTIMLFSSITIICSAASIKIASTLSKPLTEAILQGYQDTTGITPEVIYIAPGTLTDRLGGLYKKKIDCLIGPGQEEFYLAQHFNMLLPYTSDQLYEVPQKLQAKKNYWTNIWVDYIAFLSNKTRLAKLGISAPENWLEMLNHRLKDEIVLGDYDTSATTYAGIISIWQMQGESISLHYAHNWNRHNIKFVKDHSDAVQDVVRGRKALTLMPLSIALSLAKQNQNLCVTIPQDANKHLFIGAAIMKSTQQEQLAQQFIDYLLSDPFIDSMNIISPYVLWHVRHFEDNPQRQALLGNVKIAADDMGWSALTKKEIIKQWKKS